MDIWRKYKQTVSLGFPDSSVGKEAACNAGDPSSIPGSGRSAGAGIGYPLQCSWASLVAQLVKSLPAMWKTWVRSPGWEDPLQKGKSSHSGILAWRIPWTIQLQSQTWLTVFHFHFSLSSLIKEWKVLHTASWYAESQQIPLDLLDCTDQVKEHLAWQPGNTAKLFLILLLLLLLLSCFSRVQLCATT